jgi:4-amino-4-deoxy-L-arabinose transferase-like glycosyltransferase
MHDMQVYESEEHWRSRLIRVSVIGLLLLGSFLRIYNFWTPDLWIDEYSTWWVVHEAWHEVAERAVQIQGQSPFYYYIVKLSTELFGEGPFSLRLPSVLFGIGVMAIAYLLGREIFLHRDAAILILAVFSVNKKLIWYSQEARPYSLALFCVMLSFLFYVAVLKRERKVFRVGYVLSTACAYYAHYLFGFILAVQALYLLAFDGGWRRQQRTWLLTFFAIAILCLPSVPLFLTLFGRRETLDWLLPSARLGPLYLVIDFLDPPVFAVTAFAVVVIVAGTGGYAMALPRPWTHLTLLWFLFPLFVFGAIPPLFGVTLLHERYVLFVLPGALVVTAWLLAVGARHGWRRWVPLVVFLGLSFVLNLHPPFQKSGIFSAWGIESWTKAAAYIESSASDGDVILYRTGFVDADQFPLLNSDSPTVSHSQWPLTANLSRNHSYPMLGLPFRVSDQTRPYVSSVVRQAAKSRRVWIVGVGDELKLIAGALTREEGFQKTKETSYGAVTVILFEQQG